MFSHIWKIDFREIDETFQFCFSQNTILWCLYLYASESELGETTCQVTRSLAAKAFQTDLPLCKETFFSAEMEDHLVQWLVRHLTPIVSDT